MYKLDVTNENGETLALMPNKAYTVTGVDGLNPPTSTINSSETLGAGALFNSSTVNVRNLVIMVQPEYPVEKNRINLYRYFKVGRKITVHYSNGSRDVYIDGYIESFDTTPFSKRQTVQISILCLQPFFRDAMEIVEQLSQVIDMFEFPFAIDEPGKVFSEIDKTYERTIINSGEATTGMIIRLTASGSVVSPVIYDATNRTSFGLDVSMGVGDEIIINTNHSEKSVMKISGGTKTDIINSIMADATWFELEPGETVFAFEAESGAEYLNVEFSHYDLYEGV